MRAFPIMLALVLATSGAEAQIAVPKLGGGAGQKQDIPSIEPIRPPIMNDPIVLPDPPSTKKGIPDFKCPPEICKPSADKNQIN